MTDRGRHLFHRPDVDPRKIAEEGLLLTRTMNLAKKLIHDYAGKAPPNARMICSKLQKHADNDLVGLIAFPEGTLSDDPVAVSSELVSGKRRFMLMFSPLFLKQMEDTKTQREMILGVLNAADYLVREIDGALERKEPIMLTPEYNQHLALSQQPRN